MIIIIILNDRQTSNIRRNLVVNNLADHSDVDGASPVGAAPTTSSFSTWHLSPMDRARQLQDETTNIEVFGLGAVYILEVLRYNL